MIARVFVLTFFALNLLSISPAIADLKYEYEFDTDLSESSGGTALVATGGSVSGGRFNFGFDEGLTLNAPAISAGVYSIGIKFHFSEYTGYQRIIDFEARTADTGLYTIDDRLVVYNYVASNPLPLSTTSDMVLYVTRDASGIFSGYLNGVQVYTADDTNSWATFSTDPKEINFFLDDFAVGGEASDGSVDYIRVYDTALSASEVAALSAVPEPTSLLLMGSAALSGWLVKRRKRSSANS